MWEKLLGDKPFLVAIGLLSYFGVKDGDTLIGGRVSPLLPGNPQQWPGLEDGILSPDWTRGLRG